MFAETLNIGAMDFIDEYFSSNSIVYFLVFAIFAGYLSSRAGSLKGSYKKLVGIIQLISVAGIIIGITFLGFYGVQISWGEALLLLCISILTTIVSAKIITSIIGDDGLLILSVLAVPILGFLLIINIP